MVHTYKCPSEEYEMEINGVWCLFRFNSANLEDALKWVKYIWKSVNSEPKWLFSADICSI